MADDAAARARTRSAGRPGAGRSRHPIGRRPDSRVPDPRRGGRQPQPVGRQCRVAIDRPRLHGVADSARSRSGRVLAGLGCIRPLARSHRGPVRPKDAAAARYRALDPSLPGGGVRADHRGPDRREDRRRHLRGHGLSHHAGPHHRTLGSGARANEVHRPVVGARWRHRGPRPTRGGFPSRALRLGIGLPDHATARGRRPLHGVAVRPGARERDRGSGRQPGRHPVGGPGRDAHPRHQFRAGAQHGCPRDRAGGYLRGRDRRVRHPPTSGEGSPVRPGHRGQADILGRRAGWHHRLRIADGRDVHRPAIPPERPAVLDVRGRDARSSRPPWRWSSSPLGRP